MARGPVPQGANGSQQPGSAAVRMVTVPPLTTGSETSVVDGWAVSLEVDDAHADMSRVTSTTAILASLTFGSWPDHTERRVEVA